MLKKMLATTLIVFLTGCMGGAAPDRIDQEVYNIRDGRWTTLDELVPLLMRQRIVIVGEHHTDQRHHRAQLEVIQALERAGASVAIGLEMFRSDSQTELDRWVAGELEKPDFKQIYYDNWTFPWDIYANIFEYARQRQIPMIGLNVSREITSQVAREGFDSLSAEQRGKLSDVTCIVDEEYMSYIRRAFGAHAHGKMNFTHFCEAQLVWDSVMAVNAVDFLEANPDAILVLLCGAGHAQKGAIPRQIRNRSSMANVVLLPETPDSITVESITAEDADYLLGFDD